MSLVLIILILPFIIILAILVKLTSRGPILYWTERIGKNNVIFSMPKFRSMKIDTPTVATHLLEDPEQYYTSFGSFLRKTSFDELPQLWTILIGKMSFVGPRPALFNQDDLIDLRTKKGIHEIKPGLTGWAQINGRDEISINEKVKYDHEYLTKSSMKLDIYILWLTFVKVLKGDDVSH